MSQATSSTPATALYPHNRFYVHSSRRRPHVLPFLTHADRNVLQQTCKNWTIAKRTFEIECCYKVLLERIHQNEAIFLQHGNHLHQEMLGTVLGAGGSKKAIALSNGRALMVPNMDVESLYRILPRWQRMVYEETVMSRFLRSMNLLTPNSERVQLCFSEKPHAPSMPAYVSESVCGFSFCRFPGSFEPIFDSFFGGNINFVYNPPKKESKSGQNNPGNRRNLNSQTDSQTRLNI